MTGPRTMPRISRPAATRHDPNDADSAHVAWLRTVVDSGAIDSRGVLRWDVTDPSGVRHLAREDRAMWRMMNGYERTGKRARKRRRRRPA